MHPKTETTAARNPRRPYKPRTYRHEIRPGGLNEEDQDRIVRLADAFVAKKRPVPAGRIAAQIGKHPGTVWWFLVRQGYVIPSRPQPGVEPVPDARGRKMFSATEDDFLLTLRRDGMKVTEIAARFNERFAHKRTRHSLDVRLAMLAATED